MDWIATAVFLLELLFESLQVLVSPVLQSGGHLCELIANKLLKYGLAFRLVQLTVFRKGQTM